jgi:hypothetical protein
MIGLKTQNFMLVSKIQTYLSDKMHLKKVITKKHAKSGHFEIVVSRGRE